MRCGCRATVFLTDIFCGRILPNPPVNGAALGELLGGWKVGRFGVAPGAICNLGRVLLVEKGNLNFGGCANGIVGDSGTLRSELLAAVSFGGCGTGTFGCSGIDLSGN